MRQSSNMSWPAGENRVGSGSSFFHEFQAIYFLNQREDAISGSAVGLSVPRARTPEGRQDKPRAEISATVRHHQPHPAWRYGTYCEIGPGWTPPNTDKHNAGTKQRTAGDPVKR